MLKLGKHRLEVVSEYKYLGVPFSRGLHQNSRPAPFGAYFERIHKRALARSMVVHYLGAQRDGLRPKTGLKLYIMLVRPILEYAIQSEFCAGWLGSAKTPNGQPSAW